MAYLLDTDILSEIRKGRRASPAVTAWLENVVETEVFLSVLVLGEVRRGAELRRRDDPQTAFYLDRWLAEVIRRYAQRILPVDLEVAQIWAQLSLAQPVPIIDSLIAATALRYDLILVTRNLKDIRRTGVRTINPFEA